MCALLTNSSFAKATTRSLIRSSAEIWHIIDTELRPFTVPMKSSNVKSSSSTYGVVPPSNFSYVEENICRCTFPITRHNLSFIQTTSLTYIVNLSGKRHDSLIQAFFEEKNIEVVSTPCSLLIQFTHLMICLLLSQKLVLQEGESPPFSPLSSLEAWIASTIEVILTKSCECSILLVGG